MHRRQCSKPNERYGESADNFLAYPRIYLTIIPLVPSLVIYSARYALNNYMEEGYMYHGNDLFFTVLHFLNSTGCGRNTLQIFKVGKKVMVTDIKRVFHCCLNK